jgi:ubiquinone/menaquinone biosynthesis C-methylase UbiE
MKDSQIPEFRKSDRYKKSTYRAFNWKMPPIYDNLIWMKLCQVDTWDQTIISEIDRSISSCRILDVGCATGRVLYKLAESGAKKLSGADIAPNIIEVARQKLQSIDIEADLKVADAEDNLPWPDNSFDYAILSGVIHHFFRPIDAFREIGRVLDKAGKLIIADPWFPVIVRQIINSWLFFFPHDGDCCFYTPNQVIHLIAEAGMTNIDYRKAGSISYVVTGFKS